MGVTSCCFQVLCTACCSKLTDDEGLFQCPFCRGCERHLKSKCRHPLVPIARQGLDKVLRFAGRATNRAASDAGQLLGELGRVFREDEPSPTAHSHTSHTMSGAAATREPSMSRAAEH